MAQAAVNVHTLPKTAILTPKAFRARVRRLVLTIERLGAHIYLSPEADTSYLIWDDVHLPLSIHARQRALIDQDRRAYLDVLWRTWENARERVNRQHQQAA